MDVSDVKKQKNKWSSVWKIKNKKVEKIIEPEIKDLFMEQLQKEEKKASTEIMMIMPNDESIIII